MQELNRVFRDECIPILFKPFPCDGGPCSNVIKCYKSVYERNKKGNIIIWVDSDIYVRSEDNKKTYKNKPKNIPDFLFNNYNYEDFISLHLNLDELINWNRICVIKKHNILPLVSCEYLKLFKGVFTNYVKGDFPIKDFNITILNQAINNNKNSNIVLKSDFLDYIEKLLKDYCS